MKSVLLLGAIIVSHLTAFSQIPTDTLLLYMPFNGNAMDESGNGNNGSVNGASLTADRFGTPNAAYSFDGVDDRIDITNNALEPDNSVTVNYWFSPDQNWNAASDYQIMFQSDIAGDTDGDFILAFNRSNCFSAPSTNDGKVNFELQGDLVNGNSVVCNAYGITRVGTTTTSWNAGVWYMITAIVNEGEIKIYANGQLQGSHPCTSSLFVSGQDITLGLYDSPQPISALNGSLDDIRIYSRALTDQEIGSLYTEVVNITEIENNVFQLFPNPATSQITIEGEQISGNEVKIVNVHGKIVLSQDLNSDKVALDLGALSSAGIYFVQMYSQEGELLNVAKFLKK